MNKFPEKNTLFTLFKKREGLYMSENLEKTDKKLKVSEQRLKTQSIRH